MCPLLLSDVSITQATMSIRARTDYANRAYNVMIVAKLVPRTADEPSMQGTAILRSLIDYTESLISMDTAEYFQNSLAELVEIWHTVRSV
jgi:hypothetical protein